LSALVALFPAEDGSYDVLPEFWFPEAMLRDRLMRHGTFDVWAKRGHLALTEGNIVDHDMIERRVRELCGLYRVEGIAVDPWSAKAMLARLQADGFPALPQSQTLGALTAATKKLEALILTGKLRHGGHPVLRFCAANVTVEQDHAENIKPSKKKSTDRIDGISALVNALAVALVTTTGSVYDRREVALVDL
jgi:phage terminase large subunit-like protein